MEENREKQIPIVQSRQDDEIEIDLKESFTCCYPTGRAFSLPC